MTTSDVVTPELQRVTVAFNEVEDRLSLTGSQADGAVLVVWLTQRMLDRLVPHLCQWLEAREPITSSGTTPRAAVVHTMSQQRALSRLSDQREAPVVPTAETRSWLATAVDVRAHEHVVMLVLRTEQAEQRAQLSMQPLLLRQWLAIVLQQYQRGGWSLSAWPEWMLESQSGGAAVPAGGVLH